MNSAVTIMVVLVLMVKGMVKRIVSSGRNWSKRQELDQECQGQEAGEGAAEVGWW